METPNRKDERTYTEPQAFTLAVLGVFCGTLVIALAVYSADTIGVPVGALVLALTAAGLAMLVAVIALAARVRRLGKRLAETRARTAEKEGGGGLCPGIDRGNPPLGQGGKNSAGGSEGGLEPRARI